MRRLFFILFILIGSSSAWCQSNPLENGQKLIADFSKINGAQESYYAKYLIVLEHIGPIQFQNLNMAEMAKGDSANELRRLKLTAESRSLFVEHARLYDPKNFSGPDKETARRVRNIGLQLHSFAQSIDGEKGFDLIQRYESEGYSIRRSLKTRMYHLPSEIMRFAAAIVIVRIATCFGDSPQKVLEHITTWRTPKMMASNSDPVCVDELIEMLKSPIFYAGFTAFVAGSSVANAATLKALKRFDPDHGTRAQAFEKKWLPNIALAVGFMSDHVLKTLLENQHLKECAKVTVPDAIKSTFQMIKNNPSPTLYGSRPFSQSVIALDYEGEESYEVIDYYSSFKGVTCRKAWKSLSSNQFLSEEIGVGLAGLVTSAVAMSKTIDYASQAKGYVSSRQGVQSGIAQGKTILSRAAQGSRLAGRLKKYSVVFTSIGSGPIGFAVGTARMVLFLGLFHVINPVIEKVYFTGVLKPDVDEKTKNFAEESWRYTPSELPFYKEKQCAEHYSGMQESGGLPICTHLPLLAKLETFHDISKTWRNKHILKDFHTSHSKWKMRLTSFINNYLMSAKTLETLSRTREMRLKYLDEKIKIGENRVPEIESYISEHHELMFKKNKELIKRILNKYYPVSSARDQVLNFVEKEYQRELDEQDYESPISDEPLSNPQRQIYDLVDSREFLKFVLETLPHGNPYKGINGRGHFPTTDELYDLAKKIIDFVGDKDDDNYEYIEVAPKTAGQADYLVHPNSKLLRSLGMPLDFSNSPRQVDIIRLYLQSTSSYLNAIALLLFQEWAPYMRGRFEKRSEQYNSGGGTSYNPRGMHPRQYKLYKSIVSSLEHYSPELSWEFLYILSSYGELPQRVKTPEDAQFHESSQGFETKSLSDFVLTQLICGKNASYANLFGDNGGVALQFHFPHLTGERLCEQLLHPIHMIGESQPSPFRSVFVTEDGLNLGLHQHYIRAPRDENKPLLFDTEQEAGDWWNQVIRPPALQRLQRYGMEYSDLVKRDFHSRVQATERLNKSWYDSALNFIGKFWGGQSETDRKAQRSTSTESLSLSIINEFHHYREAISHLMSDAEKKVLEPHLISSALCLVHLLDSISEKKYRFERDRCESALGGVKLILIDRNGKYNNQTLKDRFSEIKELDLNNEQRRDRILIAIGEKIQGLFTETELYNELANESFQFNLEEGEYQ